MDSKFIEIPTKISTYQDIHNPSIPKKGFKNLID